MMHPWDRESELYEMPEELFQKMNSGKLTGEQWDKLYDEWWHKTAGDIREYQKHYPQQKINLDMGKLHGINHKNAQLLTPQEFKDFHVGRFEQMIETMGKENTVAQEKQAASKQKLHTSSKQDHGINNSPKEKAPSGTEQKMETDDDRRAIMRERFRQMEENKELTQQQEPEV